MKFDHPSSDASNLKKELHKDNANIKLSSLIGHMHFILNLLRANNKSSQFLPKLIKNKQSFKICSKIFYIVNTTIKFNQKMKLLLRNRKNNQFCRQNQKLRVQSQNEYELNSLLVFVTKLFNSLHHSFSQADLQTIKIVSSPRNRRKINIWFKKKKIKFRPRTNTANQHILDHCFY